MSAAWTRISWRRSGETSAFTKRTLAGRSVPASPEKDCEMGVLRPLSRAARPRTFESDGPDGRARNEKGRSHAPQDVRQFDDGGRARPDHRAGGRRRPAVRWLQLLEHQRAKPA